MTEEAMHNLQDVWRSDWEYMPISRRIPKITRTSLSIDADALLRPLVVTTPSSLPVWKNEREVMVSYVQMMLKDFDRIDVRRVRIVNHDELPNWRFQCAACGGIFTRSEDFTREEAWAEYERNFTPEMREYDGGETASVCHGCYTQMMGELPPTEAFAQILQVPDAQRKAYVDGSWGEPIDDSDSIDEPLPEEPANEPTDEEIKEYRQEMDKLQWEMDHPEERCPPRE